MFHRKTKYSPPPRREIEPNVFAPETVMMHTTEAQLSMGHMYISGKRVNIPANTTHFWQIVNPVNSDRDMHLLDVRIYTNSDERIRFAEGAPPGGEVEPTIPLHRGDSSEAICQVRNGPGEPDGVVLPIEGKATAAAPFRLDLPLIIPPGEVFTVFVTATGGATDTAVSLIWTEH